MYKAVVDIDNSQQINRYSIFSNGNTLSFMQVVSLLKESQVFRSFFNNLLRDSPFDAFRWETPALTKESAKRSFEFVLINTPAFANRPTDYQTFNSFFSGSESVEGVVSFDNLGKDARLIVPCPHSDRDVYGHLADFVRGAPDHQVNALWRCLGDVVMSHLSSEPMWINTAGGGVSWLHLRIDRYPKYYVYDDYKVR